MLITRSDTCTTRTRVSAVTDNRVVGKGVDHTAGADQHTVAGVAVNHVLVDGRAGNADVSSIARTNTVPAVQGDLTIPNEYVREVSARGVRENAIRSVVGKHGMACRYSRTRSGVQAVAVAGQPHVLERNLDFVRRSAGKRVDSIKCTIPDDAVSHVQIQIVRFIDGDAITGIEPEDDAVFYVNGLGLEDVYSIYAITEPVNGKTSDGNNVSGCGVDHDPVHERGEDRSKRTGTIERD